MPFDHANLTSPPVFIRIEKPLCVVADYVPSFRVDTYEFGMGYNTVPEGVVYGRWTLVYSAWEEIPRSLDNVSSYEISRPLCNAIAAIEHRISLISSDISATGVVVFRRTIEEIRGLVYCRAIPLISEDGRGARHDRNLALQNSMYEFSLAVRWFGEAVDEWYSKKKDGEDPEPCQRNVEH